MDGTVVVIADVTLDAVGDVHAFGDLAIDGVGASSNMVTDAALGVPSK